MVWHPQRPLSNQAEVSSFYQLRSTVVVICDRVGRVGLSPRSITGSLWSARYSA